MKVIISAYVRFPNALAWHALEVCRGLHAAGHEVFLLCQRDSPLAEWSKSEPFSVNRVLNLNRVDPRDIVAGVSALQRIFREFQPDILNPHCPPGHSYLSLVRRLTKCKAPLIRTIAEPRPPKRNFVNRVLFEQSTEEVIVTTDSSRKRYSQVFHANHDRVHTVFPGFRAEDFVNASGNPQMREALPLKEGQMLAGIVARMSPEKGQEVLIEALQLLAPEIRNRVHCVIAGPDSRERNREHLQQLAIQKGVNEHITFLGHLENVKPLLRQLDLGIITSTRSEAICRIALEYMSFGIPIVSSDVNILPEVVQHGRNGWVFPNHDAAALAACLSEGVLHSDERRRRGREGYEMVRNEFSSPHEIQQVTQVYAKARASRQ